MRQHPRQGARRRRVAILAASAVLAGLAMLAPAAAHAYNVDEGKIPWPFTTITYTYETEGPFAFKFEAAAEQAIQEWNEAGVGYQFVRVNSRDQANFIFFSDRRRDEERCMGRTYQGYNLAQGLILLDGRCNRYVSVLGAAHEIGHLLVLDHEDSVCAVMNTGTRPGPTGSRRRPSSCRPGPQYYKNPVRSDDRHGARSARRRPFRLPRNLCYPDDEPRSPAIRVDPLCKFQYDCRGIAGPAPVSPDLTIEQEGDEYGFTQPCRRSNYDTSFARASSSRAPPTTSAGRPVFRPGPREVFGP